MIGVVIAVRDQAQYIGEAIDSILAQTLPASQIVVVDDASTDGTGDVARSRGVDVVLAEGKGPGIGRNIGARLIDTEFIAFLDGDDRFTPERNRLLYEAIGDAPACQGMIQEFYDPGREVELAARFAITAEPTHGSPLAMLIRRSVFQELGGLDEDDGAHDLFGFMQRLGPVPLIDDVVLERRIHGGNRTITDREGLRMEYLKSARAAILARRREAQA